MFMVRALPRPRSETKAAVTVTQQSAICAASSTSRSAQRRPAEDWLPPLLIASLGSVLNICRSGITPNSTPASSRDKQRHQDQRWLRHDDMEPHRVFGGWMPVSQAAEGHPRQTAGARAPENRNHKGLDQDLADDAPAARSNGHADGDLAGAVCRTRCEQAAQVGAGGEQHNAGQPQHPSQKTARRLRRKSHPSGQDESA